MKIPLLAVVTPLELLVGIAPKGTQTIQSIVVICCQQEPIDNTLFLKTSHTPLAGHTKIKMELNCDSYP